MLLGQIRDYVQARGVVSLQDIVRHFDIAADTAEFALAYWQQKGKIRAPLAAACQTGCSTCTTQANPQYEWVQRAIPLHFHPRLR